MVTSEFRQEVTAFIDAEIERFYAEVPSASHLAKSSAVNPEYFKRHTIETILRIRLARMADGKAISVLAKSHPRVAASWAKYAEEEMLHDRMFLKDLERLGVSADDVYGSEPLAATKLLQGYLYYTLEHEGALGLLCKAFFIEYSTLKTQKEWNDNIARNFGPEAIKGAAAHLSYDDAEDHSGDVWNALSALVTTPADEARVLGHLRVYANLLRAYFAELDALINNGRDGRWTLDRVAADSAAA
jgi:hypothetical protein